MYEVYSGGKVPFAELTGIEVLRAVSAGRRLERPSSTTPDASFDLLRACMLKTDTDRPTMAEALGRLEELCAQLMPGMVSGGSAPVNMTLEARLQEETSL